ncbi:MAG: hypothetical protein A3J75_01225 [Acidobacteria bacterium RBG_16_68_9]|nr:MAG: hypothetical protein A3J75_01225 [Acidobacteria bacterium RBG_16_68_9]
MSRPVLASLGKVFAKTKEGFFLPVATSGGGRRGASDPERRATIGGSELVKKSASPFDKLRASGKSAMNSTCEPLVLGPSKHESSRPDDFFTKS